MIEISVYYLLGSIVVLPTISIYFTREYYKNKIYNLIEYYQDIIKIEKPQKGDDLRIIGPKVANISLWSAVLNRGKKSLSLNLYAKYLHCSMFFCLETDS